MTENHEGHEHAQKQNPFSLTPQDMAVLLTCCRVQTRLVDVVEVMCPGMRTETAKQDVVNVAVKLEGILDMLHQRHLQAESKRKQDLADAAKVAENGATMVPKPGDSKILTGPRGGKANGVRRRSGRPDGRSAAAVQH